MQTQCVSVKPSWRHKKKHYPFLWFASLPVAFLLFHWDINKCLCVALNLLNNHITPPVFSSVLWFCLLTISLSYSTWSFWATPSIFTAARNLVTLNVCRLQRQRPNLCLFSSYVHCRSQWIKAAAKCVKCLNYAQHKKEQIRCLTRCQHTEKFTHTQGGGQGDWCVGEFL